MNQPARGQEPSMDEILASIRRIIADDDPGQMPPKGSETQFSSPSRAADPQSDLDRPSMRAPAPPPPERTTREDEIDSMLAHLQAATRSAPSAADPVPSGGMVGAEPTSRLPVSDGRPDRSFEDRSSEPPAPTSRRGPATCSGCRRTWAPFGPGRGGGRFRFQRAGAYGASARRPHARGFHQRTAAANAQDLARRKSSGHGRAPGARRDRARVARTRLKQAANKADILSVLRLLPSLLCRLLSELPREPPG